jgi:hypothetical protein
MIIKKFEEYKPSQENILYYYAFDWDDNILNMPTKIMLMSEDGNEVGISTEDYAKYRNIIGDKKFTYQGETIEGYIKDENGQVDYNKVFRFFRDSDPNNFLNDVKKALSNEEYGPSWGDFIECLSHGSLFSIITARGHESENLKKGVKYIIDEVLSSSQKLMMYDNLYKFVYLFKEDEDYPKIPKGKLSENKLVEKYLDNCMFVGVSAPSQKGRADNPEEAKKISLMEFKSKVNNLAEKIGYKASIGFSDDDPGNVQKISELFNEMKHEDYSSIIYYIVKDTHGGEVKTSYEKTLVSENKDGMFKLNVEISNIDKSTLNDFIKMFKFMEWTGAAGTSREMKGYCDGDGHFRPKIKIDGKSAIDFETDEDFDDGIDLDFGC